MPMRIDRALAGLDTGPNFTAALTEPAVAGTVSAIIATYNRCPFDPAAGRLRDNPLTWALDSLLCQHGDALAEIVVVDDGSTDHTPAVLDYYANLPVPVALRTRRLPKHAGAWAARNLAIDMATHPRLLFGDDDCVFAPHYAAGAAYVLRRLTEQDPQVGGVMLPFYYRALRPRTLAPSGRIGRLRLDQAHFNTRFHTWPVEYLDDIPRLDQPSGIVAPLPVDLIGGTAILTRRAMADAGGFVDLSAWPTSYSDHLHLSADLADAGYHLYHCPDPRLSAVHLKFGAAGRYPISAADLATVLPGVDRRLGELVGLSAQPRSDTGCRVADERFHADAIGSFLTFFAGRSLAGGVAWGHRTWREFVVDGEVHSLAIRLVPQPADREAAWRLGLGRGARYLVSGARPGLTADQVHHLLDEIGRLTGQPPVIDWQPPT